MSVTAISVFIIMYSCRTCSGTTHGVELAPSTLDGTDGVVYNLLGCTDTTILFVVFDGFDLDAFALEFVPV